MAEFINLGRIVGRDAKIQAVNATYTNNGGEPGVEIDTVELEVPEGEAQQVELSFNFFNLVNDPITSQQIDAIANDEVIKSANTLSATGLTSLWEKIKEKFAAKTHTHGTNGIDDSAITSAKLASNSVTEAKILDGAVTHEKLASGCVTKDNLEKSLGDSIFHERGVEFITAPSGISTFNIEHNFGFKPLVLVSIDGLKDSIGKVSVGTISRSENGFTIAVQNGNSNPLTFGVVWLAIKL